MEALRQLIEEYLRTHDETQAGFAAATGVKQNVISRWLSGHVSSASSKNLRKVAPVLGLTYEELLRRTGDLPDSEVTADGLPPRLASFIAQVEAAFHAMTDQEWQVREQAGRALFSVPPSHATHRRSDSAHPARPDHSATSSAADSGPDGVSRGWWPRVQAVLA